MLLRYSLTFTSSIENILEEVKGENNRLSQIILSFNDRF